MVPAPTRLRLADLLHVTDRFADDVLGGHYDHLVPTQGAPASERWFTRLHGDDELDVWLIGWVPERSTELHDHGGSLGALTVLTGSLRETRWDGRRLRTRTLNAGDQAAFPLGWVHDVVWARESVGTGGSGVSPALPAPTLSVHAYSPPLTVMSYYDAPDGGFLRRSRTELTTQPEGI